MTAPPREPIGWICDCDLDTLCSGKSSAICPSPREMYVNGHPRKWFPLYLDAAPAPSADKPMLDPRYCHHAWEYGQRYVGCVVHCGKPQPPRGQTPSAEPPAQAATDNLDRMIAILQARDLGIAEFHAMQIPIAATITTLRATIEQQAREIAELTAEARTANERHHVETERRVRAEAERDALRAVIERAANVMHGDGVMDQGQAWDECVRVLDAERAKVRT